jgi:hypothetical protein
MHGVLGNKMSWGEFHMVLPRECTTPDLYSIWYAGCAISNAGEYQEQAGEYGNPRKNELRLVECESPLDSPRGEIKWRRISFRHSLDIA